MGSGASAEDKNWPRGPRAREKNCRRMLTRKPGTSSCYCWSWRDGDDEPEEKVLLASMSLSEWTGFLALPCGEDGRLFVLPQPDLRLGLTVLSTATPDVLPITLESFCSSLNQEQYRARVDPPISKSTKPNT